MSLERVRDTWTELGRRDAFWAVLTGHFGAARPWKTEDFFRSGADEIETVLRDIPVEFGRDAALDFGCGAGRLTRALGEHFGRATGVDIAPTMIRQARRLNRGRRNVQFVVNERADLSLFPAAAFDLVYSNITLQHMPPELSRAYIAEFFRVARPGGMVVFQVPAEYVPAPRPRTVADAPLPSEEMRAEITVSTRRLTCAPGAPIPLVMRLKNVSNVLWPAGSRDDGRFSLRLGDHWLSPWRKRMLRLDDVRAQLPHDLAPGEETEVGMHLTAPEEPGRYLLEIDVVQEGVIWFQQRGSRTAWVPVRVSRRLPPGTVRGLPPRMEMYGIPRPEVEALIGASGGEVILVKDDDAPGSDWTSYRYYARVSSRA